MTTIAYADGVIAYDSRCCAGSTIVDNDYNKRIDMSGAVFIFAGSTAHHEKAAKAFFEDDDECGELDAEALVYHAGKLYTLCIENEKIFRSPQPLDRCFALGSGTHHALTAMDMGADAKAAVKMAAKRDVGTGGRIRTIKVKEATMPKKRKGKKRGR